MKQAYSASNNTHEDKTTGSVCRQIDADQFNTIRQPGIISYVPRLKWFLFSITLMFLVFTACDKDEDEDSEIKVVTLEEYLDLHPEAVLTEGGVYLIVSKEGSGPKPVAGEKLFAFYKLTLLNEIVVESRLRDTVKNTFPYEFFANDTSMLKGWNKGIMELKKGSIATMIIPDSLGYIQVNGIIPANSPLKFNVELLDVVE